MQKTKHRIAGFPLYASIELVYWMGYAGSAFLSAYLVEHGFSSSIVGTIMSIVNCIGVLSAAVMGNWSDKIRSPRKVFLVCALGTAFVVSMFPVGIRWKIVSFSLVIPLYLLWAFFCRPMSGLCDGWFLSIIDRDGSFSYGTIRYIGSFAYAMMCIVYSWAAKRYGSQDIIFYMYGAINLLLVLLCIYARHDEAPVERAEKGKRVGVRAVAGHYHLIIYLVCHCLLNLPMYCSPTFIPFKLIELTGTTGALGNVTAFRSLAEIPSLILSVYMIRKIGARRSLMLVMMSFAAVQLLFIFAGGMTMITVAMIILGFINGAFMACQMRYVHSIAPQEAATSAITLCTSMALVSAVVGNFVGGLLVDRFNTTAYFLFAMISVLLALGIFLVSVPVGKRIGKPLPQFPAE